MPVCGNLQKHQNGTALLDLFVRPAHTFLRKLGLQYEYLWADPKYRKPVRLPAPEYISALFDWLEVQVRKHFGHSACSMLCDIVPWHVSHSCSWSRVTTCSAAV